MNDTVMELAKYEFTKQEIINLADQLQRELRRQKELENEKKSAAAQFNEQKQTCTALAEKIADGFELRHIECRVLLNEPRNGIKRHVRNDTDQVIRELMMTDDEKQVELFDDDSPQKKGRRGGP
jgi:hypothetical protein